MRLHRSWCLVVTVVSAAGPICGQAAGGGAGAATAEPSPGSQVAIEVACNPVSISWPTSSSASTRIKGPELAVVSTDLRPKDVALFLDGRFVGRARYFNGKKGFLYLQPGRYRLVAAKDGLQPAAFSIDARPGCRFDIKHRMLKGRKGEPPQYDEPAGKGKPVRWIYGPVGGSAVMPVEVERRGGGPDTSLRPDLSNRRTAAESSRLPTATLRLTVEPASATVFLDGRKLVTGDELGRMVQPLAISAGSHTMVVRAAGFADRTVSFEVGEAETRELEVVLEPVE
jgi:hypothetical protein